MVELPSQVMENWASEPEVLKMYAKHYQTGETMPDALIQKIQESGHFNQGFATVEYVAAALLDMDWYSNTEVKDFDVNAFEKASMDKYGLIKEILPRYRSTYFSHILMAVTVPDITCISGPKCWTLTLSKLSNLLGIFITKSWQPSLENMFCQKADMLTLCSSISNSVVRSHRKILCCIRED